MDEMWRGGVQTGKIVCVGTFVAGWLIKRAFRGAPYWQLKFIIE